MIRLRVRRYDDQHITLEALSGIDRFGFGTFLCDLDPGEIDCDAFSKAALIAAPYKRGLNGMEIWADHRIAWGYPSERMTMPIDEISKQPGADAWLSQIDTAPTQCSSI